MLRGGTGKGRRQVGGVPLYMASKVGHDYGIKEITETLLYTIIVL